MQGGVGGGGGEGPDGQGQGSGSGFAISARPIGTFMITGNESSWRPAADMGRIILGGQVVVIVALLTIRSIVKAQAKAAFLVSRAARPDLSEEIAPAGPFRMSGSIKLGRRLVRFHARHIEAPHTRIRAPRPRRRHRRLSPGMRRGKGI